MITNAVVHMVVRAFMWHLSFVFAYGHSVAPNHALMLGDSITLSSYSITIDGKRTVVGKVYIR